MISSKKVSFILIVSVLAVTACAPRKEIAQQRQYHAKAVGISGLPLYKTDKIQQDSLSEDEKPIAMSAMSKEANRSMVQSSLPRVDHIATASITPLPLEPIQTKQIATETSSVQTSQENSLLYQVQPGDTIYSIARQFKTSPNDIIRMNDLSDPNQLELGQNIYVKKPTELTQKLPKLENYKVQPGDTIYSIGRRLSIPPKEIMQNNQTIDPNNLYPGQILKLSLQEEKLLLPVNGKIQQRNDLKGILISALDGETVRASAMGEVIYVGKMDSYGKMILVRHEDGLITNYARLKEAYVKEGQKVSKGEMIASAGASKEFATSDILFEVRKGTKPVSPLNYLG